MKVYKVVAIYPRERIMVSCRTSAVKSIYSPAVLEYEIGKVTRPNFGFIYCFRSESDAVSFAWHYANECQIRILVGVGIPVKKSVAPQIIRISSPLSIMTMFWEGEYALPMGYTAATAPEGTVLMRTFRPLKEIKF